MDAIHGLAQKIADIIATAMNEQAQRLSEVFSVFKVAGK